MQDAKQCRKQGPTGDEQLAAALVVPASRLLQGYTLVNGGGVHPIASDVEALVDESAGRAR